MKEIIDCYKGTRKGGSGGGRLHNNSQQFCQSNRTTCIPSVFHTNISANGWLLPYFLIELIFLNKFVKDACTCIVYSNCALHVNDCDVLIQT